MTTTSYILKFNLFVQKQNLNKRNTSWFLQQTLDCDLILTEDSFNFIVWGKKILEKNLKFTENLLSVFLS